MSEEICFPLHQGLTMQPHEIECNQPRPTDGWTCKQSYTSSGYSSSGAKIKAKEFGIGFSEVSMDDACDRAYERAVERAAELLRYKYLVTARITGYGQDNYKFVSPKGDREGEQRWEGICKKKPSEYKVTAVIPHLETIEPLWIAVQLLRKQTERPYIIVIDTGSSPRTVELLERMRAEDLEITYLKSHSYRHTSCPVAIALDLAHSICATEYLLHTHVDVFLRRDDLIEDCLRICGEKIPVVGYQMSERSWITDEWRGMVGHSLAMMYLPEIEKTGATWSIEKAFRSDPSLIRQNGGWPDTETGFNRILKKNGIKPYFIGDDQNFIRQVDRNIDHVRSYPGARMYSSEHFSKAEDWMLDAMKEAFQRLSLTSV